MKVGDTVSFHWRPADARYTGVIVDRIVFNGRVRLGVRVSEPTRLDPKGCPPGGRVYDVWPFQDDVMEVQP